MPLTLPNGSTYRLCLLDTNALSEIVKHAAREGRGFITRFPPEEFAPCFTVYNLVELRRQREVYRKFVDFFSIYPALLAKPHELILESEIESNGRAPTVSVFIKSFSTMAEQHCTFAQFVARLFAGPAMCELESEWRNRDQEALDTWCASKANFIASRPAPNAHDARKYVVDASIDTLGQTNPAFASAMREAGKISLLRSLPSVQIMLYSQYYCIFDASWTPNDQEVTDVCISACAPYVDAVITEKFQAEIYRKVQELIPGMEVTITTLRDIRHRT